MLLEIKFLTNLGSIVLLGMELPHDVYGGHDFVSYSVGMISATLTEDINERGVFFLEDDDA